MPIGSAYLVNTRIASSGGSRRQRHDAEGKIRAMARQRWTWLLAGVPNALLGPLILANRLDAAM